MKWLAAGILGLLFAASWTELAGSGSGGGVSASPADSSTYSSLAIDSQGRPWIAWEELNAYGKVILLRHWNGSAWAGVGGSESGLGVGGVGGSNQAPSLVLDSADNPVVAWTNNYSGLFVRHWDGGAWVPYGTSDTGTGITNANGTHFNVRLRLDAADRPVVAWQFAPVMTDLPLPNQTYVKRWDGSAWVELAGSASNGGISNARYTAEGPDLAVDAAGNPVVTWLQADLPGTNRILLKQWNGTSWVGIGGSEAGDGIHGPGSWGANPSVALDSLGRPMVAFNEYGLSGGGYGEIYLRRWDGTAWIGLGGSDSGGGISAAGGAGARFPSLKVGPSDRPVVAWQNGPVYSTDEVYVRRWDGTAWVGVAGSDTGGGVSQTPTVSSGFVSLALTPAGDPGVTWTEGFSNTAPSTPEIFYRQLAVPADPLLTVDAMVPAPGSLLKKNPGILTLTLSAPPDPTTVNGVSVTLVRAGKDKQLGTADDVEIHAAVSVSGAVIKIDLCRQNLPSGAYRLRVKGSAGNGPGSAVRSLSGRLLDGEFSGSFPSGNGTDGGDFVADFSLK